MSKYILICDLYRGICQSVLEAALPGGHNVPADKRITAQVQVSLHAPVHSGIVGDAECVAPYRLSRKVCKGEALFGLHGGVVAPGVAQALGKLQVQRLDRIRLHLPAQLL